MIILKFVLLHGENGLSIIFWHINILDASYVSLQNPKPRIHEKHQNIQDLIDSKLEKSESLSTTWKFRNIHWLVATQILFIFTPILGKIPILTIIFQRGWNHQLVHHVPFVSTIW